MYLVARKVLPLPNHKLSRLLVIAQSGYVSVILRSSAAKHHPKVHTMSVWISIPILSILTHNRMRVESRRLGSSSNVVYRIGSKLPNLANMAKRTESK